MSMCSGKFSSGQSCWFDRLFTGKHGEVANNRGVLPVFQGNNILYPNQFPYERTLLADNYIGRVIMAVAKSREYVGRKTVLRNHLHKLLAYLSFLCRIFHLFKHPLQAHKSKSREVWCILLYLDRDLWVCGKILYLPAVFSGEKVKVLFVKDIHERGYIGVVTSAKRAVS